MNVTRSFNIPESLQFVYLLEQLNNHRTYCSMWYYYSIIMILLQYYNSVVIVLLLLEV